MDAISSSREYPNDLEHWHPLALFAQQLALDEMRPATDEVIDDMQPAPARSVWSRDTKGNKNNIHSSRLPNIPRILNHLRPGIVIIHPTLDRTPLADLTNRLFHVVHPNIARAHQNRDSQLTRRQRRVPVMLARLQGAPARRRAIRIPPRPVEQRRRQRVDEVVRTDAKRRDLLKRATGVGARVDAAGGDVQGRVVDVARRRELELAFVRSAVILLARFRHALALADAAEQSVRVAGGRGGAQAAGDGLVGFADGDVPDSAYLGLEVSYEDLGDEVVPEGRGEDGVDEVFVNGWGVAHVVGEKGGFDADVWDVVELGDDVVQMVGACKTVGLVDLWTKVAE